MTRVQEYIAASQIWIGDDLDFLGSPGHAAPRMIEHMQQIDLVEPRSMLEQTFVTQAGE